MKKVMRHANQFGQTLEEVLRLFEFDVNTIDDAFLYLVKEYVADEKNKVSSKVVEIRRMNPALIEFDLFIVKLLLNLPVTARFPNT